MAFFRYDKNEAPRFYERILFELGTLTPVMLIDAKGVFIYASDGFLSDMGLSAEALADMTVYDLVDQGFYDRSPSIKALTEGQDCSELSYSRDGFPVFTETKIFRNTKGETEYILCHSVRPEDIQVEMELLRHQIAYYRNKLMEAEQSKAINSNIIFQSPAMYSTLQAVDRVSHVDTSVLLFGESGVGKDVIARYIHEHSDRADKPFVTICIPMISPSLLESELFGYVAGAFTGSNKKGKIGLFEAANGGTVFLDEIGDTPLELQTKLLRVLENQEYTPVGSTNKKKLDIRIISATNKNVQKMITEGLFREDLYYRIGVIQLTIPPLRDRDGDVALLSNYFLSRFNEKYHFKKQFSNEALQCMESYSWPGNVRQLRNVVEQSVVLSDSKEIDATFTKQIIRNIAGSIPKDTTIKEKYSSSKTADSSSLLDELDQIERKRIMDALVQCNGNRKKAVELLGMSRSKLYRKLQSL